MKKLSLVAPLLVIACTPATAKVVTPIAIEAGKLLVDSVVKYVKSKGKEPSQVNCEEEWHPSENTLLILCEVQYEEAPGTIPE